MPSRAPKKSASRGNTPHLATPRNESPRARALRHMRQALISNRWLPGERLPTELQLARELRMSRRTIRAVYQQLENDGQVVGMGRAGRFRMAARAAPETTLQPASIGLLCNFYTHAAHIARRQPQHRQWKPVATGIMEAATENVRPILALDAKNLSSDGFKEFLRNPLLGLIVPDLWRFPEKILLAGFQRLRRAGIPVVVGDAADVYSQCDRVLIDYAAGTRLAVEALLARGCKKILRVWTVQNTSWLDQRDTGYAQALAVAGVASLPSLLVPEIPPRSFEPNASAFHVRSRQFAGFLVEHLRRGKIDALLLISDCDLFYVSTACRLCGLKPGADILLAGFDNYWPLCWERALEPAVPFLTVDKRDHEWGAAMVQLLLDRLAHRLPPHPKTRWITPKIVFS